MKVLITGGAGFIGSHIADAMIGAGHRVTVVDNLHPQVHSGRRKRPDYLNPKAEFVYGDVRDAALMKRLIRRADAVYHKAARVGVAQSMYEINDYVDVNIRGTSVVLDILANMKHRVKKLVVAASMSEYGEGLYRLNGDVRDQVGERSQADLEKGIYEHVCPKTRRPLTPVLTPESKPLDSRSVYATTKRVQEEMCLMVGKTYGIPAVAFRYFNVYGPRQSLNNPYTGVLAIFGSRLLNKRPPLVFEDGRQTRDFVHVRDVAHANLMALETSRADGRVLNVGTGAPRSIVDVGRDLAGAMGLKIEPKIMNEFRSGDIRHCSADIGAIKSVLGWSPRMTWAEGLTEYAAGIRQQTAKDQVDTAMAELKRHRLRHPARR